MNKTLIYTASLICLLGLTGAGCDSATPTSNSNSPNDQQTNNSELNACELLTKTIVSDYLGDVDDPTLRNTAGVVSTCTYTEPASFDSITLLVRRSQNNDESNTVNTNAKNESKNLSGVEPEDISGLGDSAYWAGGSLKQLNVFRGEDWLILSAFKDDFSKDKAIELMQMILQK
ncbi:hypothetical protein KKG46_05455 [Patescibacteria group bacterium]|nr:hypothetical protein [Patescibacteria group bacterium]